MKQLSLVLGALVSVGGCTADDTVAENVSVESSELFRGLPNNLPMLNTLGFSTTFSLDGGIGLGGEFFQDLGTNKRTCGSCHKATEGWSVSASNLRLVFELSRGLDPIFRTNDGSNSPHANVSTLAARRAAYSMLLNRGTIRVGIGVPADAEFELVAVDDPYAFASADELSLFRRPLPAANLAAIPTVMWDGRVTGTTIGAALAEQANGATQGHAASLQPLTNETREAIVDFEMGLYNAQEIDFSIGRLDVAGGLGGAENLAEATLRLDDTTTGMTPEQIVALRRWNMFDSWQNSPNAKRRQVWRGQELFNTRTHVIGRPDFTCTNCHTQQNFGTDIRGRFFAILDPATKPLRRAPDQPLYTFRNKTTNATVQTTDPGRALISGRWSDMSRFKVPAIRGLAARAPYFHDGSSPTLDHLVRAYEQFQDFVFTDAERVDLVAFLEAL
jgi:cytochrome c peroxidase